MSAFFSHLKRCRRPVVIVLEIMAVFTFLIMLGGSVFAWRLAQGPVDVGFAVDYIEGALQPPEGGWTTIGRAQLYWPDIRDAILLQVDTLAVYDNEEQVLFSVREVDFALSRSSLLIGRISPKRILIQSPVLRAKRFEDGRFDVALIPDDEAPKLDHDVSIIDMVHNMLRASSSQDSDIPYLKKLKSIEINKAQLVIEDHKIGATWFLPNVSVLAKREDYGIVVEALANIFNSAQLSHPSDASSIMLRVETSWEGEQVYAGVEFKNFDPQIFSAKLPELSILNDQDLSMDINIDAVMDRDFNISLADLNAEISEGVLDVPEFSLNPKPFKDFKLSATYKPADLGVFKNISAAEAFETDMADIFDIKNISIIMDDVKFDAKGKVTIYEGIAKGAVSITSEQFSQSKIESLWPESLKHENAYEWLALKLGVGVFSDVRADLNLSAIYDDTQGWQADLQQAYLDFKFDDMKIDYRAPLTPVTKAKGRGYFDNRQEKLFIAIDLGMLGALKVENAEIELVDVIRKGHGLADLNIKMKGPVADVFDYVSKEPIALSHSFDVARIKGVADMSVNLNFPATSSMKVEDIKLRVVGAVTDARLPDVVGDIDLTGGPFDVFLDGNDIRVKGVGALEHQKADIEYHAYLESEGQAYKSQVKARVTSDDKLRAMLGADLDLFMRGDAPVDVTYTEYQNGMADAVVNADLTPAHFYIAPFDYIKAPTKKAHSNFKAIIKNGALAEIRDLTGRAPNVTLDNATLSFVERSGEIEIKRARLSRFSIGETIGTADIAVAVSGALDIKMSGAFLDMRPFLHGEPQGNKPYENPAISLNVMADRMRTYEGETIQFGKIIAEIDNEGRFNHLEFDGIAGAGDIKLRYKPDESGRRVFRCTADDAGATLKAFGVYNDMIGGRLDISADPIRGVYDRNLIGKAVISDFVVRDAPVLAQLINALSLSGAVDLLKNEGFEFTKLEADFNWLFRPGGGLLVLKNGRTSGNSLGLTFDGTFDKANGTIVVSGTIVPLSGINKFISKIPLIGDILTGGSGVFAATYSIKGPAGNPRIVVNPLAVLAPGILRRILFE